jgi:hypothetical protein
MATESYLKNPDPLGIGAINRAAQFRQRAENDRWNSQFGENWGDNPFGPLGTSMSGPLRDPSWEGFRQILFEKGVGRLKAGPETAAGGGPSWFGGEGMHDSQNLPSTLFDADQKSAVTGAQTYTPYATLPHTQIPDFSNDGKLRENPAVAGLRRARGAAYNMGRRGRTFGNEGRKF